METEVLRSTSRRVPTLFIVVLACAASLTSAAEKTRYAHTDAIGSVRAFTDEAGNLAERHDYLPFGEEWCGTAVCGSVTPGQPKRFSGKERDVETGLDYFGARYMRANLGRFTSVDPGQKTAENLIDPQLWNRYAYVRNNPVRYVDPDGRVIELVGSPAFKQAYRAAREYVEVGGATNLLTDLDRRPEIIRIQETAGFTERDIEFDPDANTIRWNPNAGVVTPEGGRLSPSTMLVHEADHAARRLKDPRGLKNDMAVDDPQYGTAEERRVITGSETAVAKAKGESPRTSYGGRYVPVSHVTDAPKKEEKR
jgi:RHS repeat-associated protein